MLRLLLFLLFIISIVDFSTATEPYPLRLSTEVSSGQLKRCIFFNQVINRKGWLVYWHDQIIWVSDSSKKMMHFDDFLKNSFYDEGLILNGHSKAISLKRYAKKYKIYFPYLETGNKEDWIYIIPVAVKIEYRDTEPNDLDYLSFNINGKTIQLSYRFRNKYRITSIKEIRAFKLKEEKSKVKK